MSATTVIAIVEAIALAVVVLFVVGLLRSHAEILRRLEALDGGHSGAGAGNAFGISAGRPAGPPPAPSGPAHDIAGETLDGDAVKVSLGAGSPRTLLAFLSSTCAGCGPLWAGLHDGSAAQLVAPAATRLVVVTKGPERERLARLLELAPRTADVVMSTRAWEEYAIPATPHFVLADAAGGGIVGRGAANSWAQIGGLLADATDDDAIHRARSTSARAARAEEALAAAGIDAGHPSLYPSSTTVAQPGDDER